MMSHRATSAVQSARHIITPPSQLTQHATSSLHPADPARHVITNLGFFFFFLIIKIGSGFLGFQGFQGFQGLGYMGILEHFDFLFLDF